jgi:hypothetical protein
LYATRRPKRADYDARVIDGRRTLRRLEPLHVFMAALWGGGLVFAALVDWSEGPWVVLSILAWAADGLILLYLTAPAAAIIVTPSSVLVNNPYLQHIVPRHLIQGVRTDGHWTARLLVDSARPVRLVALNLHLPRGYPSSPNHRHAQLVVRLMAEVPQEASTGGVRRRVRYGNVALAALAISTGVSAAAYLLSTAP